ncbi:MAG: ankyrin repeat domain-containing protein, partial [Vulcanisaeta sp.]
FNCDRSKRPSVVDFMRVLKRYYHDIGKGIHQPGYPPTMQPQPSLDEQLLDAASIGSLIEVIELIRLGANVNARDSYGKTPLHYAVEGGHLGVVKELLKHGADVNAKDNEGRTPLHYAIMNDDIKITKVLVRRGADVNASDKSGVTSLHIAAERRYKKLVNYLIKHGADVNAKDNMGMTPLDYAEIRRYKDITKYLRKIAKKKLEKSSKKPEELSRKETIILIITMISSFFLALITTAELFAHLWLAPIIFIVLFFIYSGLISSGLMALASIIESRLKSRNRVKKHSNIR